MIVNNIQGLVSTKGVKAAEPASHASYPGASLKQEGKSLPPMPGLPCGLGLPSRSLGLPSRSPALYPATIKVTDRTIMSSFISQQPFYPQTSLEKLPRTAPPLNKFLCSKTAPPLQETTAHVLTSLTSPFYKSHTWPRFAAVPSFPRPAWQFGPAIKLCSMDMRLFL
jgi:hypothetical protein